MLRSIRWRLVMGAVMLTLLTVSAVGVVALLLMQRYMVQQERAYLAANAQAIAQQAVTFMSPVQVSPPLQQLAQTAAFLSDVTVRIVDSTQIPLADSAVAMPYTTTFGMAAAPLYFRVDPLAQGSLEAMPPDAVMPPDVVWTTETNEFTVHTTQAIPVAPPNFTIAAMPAVPGSWGETLPHGVVPAGMQQMSASSVIVVQKSPSIWGDRLTFETETLPISQTVSLRYAEGQEAVHAGRTAQVAQVGDGVMVTRGEEVMWQRPVAAEPSAMANATFLESAGFVSAGVVTAPIHAGERVVGFVELARATDLVNEPLGAIRQALAIAAGASGLLAIAVGLVMSRTLTAPIQNLAQAAALMSSGDLTARAPVMGQDELASLARQFNQMADALHRSFAELAAERDTLRRFVADASHELRTPITALRTFNELLQGPAQQDRVVQAEFLAESDAQIARLEWITRNLLDLSRWDGGMATLTVAEVEVGELVATAAAPFRALAQERNLDLRVVVPEVAVVARVDEQRLGMAVGNLLDNALKFTPAMGKVTVGVTQDAQGVKIWVEDTGMGICAEDLPHIFARFYRSPRATQAGSGLGLAIVERIVNAHGATIGVESEVGVGSRFTLRLCDVPS